MFKFYISLWVSKFYLFINKKIGNSRSDRAGLLAAKICKDFLKYVKKPKLVIAVTGTNGKTTVSNLVTNILRYDNKKVAFNDWGANFVSGHIRCFLDAVNIFNISTKDAIVLECDELISVESLPLIKPDYIIVTNICRDSIRRNAYPEYIFNRLNEAFSKTIDSTIILNADDPISSFLAPNHKKLFVAINPYLDDVFENKMKDFTCCPSCHSNITYLYKHYRHLGKFKCDNCNISSFKGDYIVEKVLADKKELILNNQSFPLLSNSIFNIFNEAQVISLFKELSYSDKFIKEALKNISIPKSREDKEVVNGINIYSRLTKGQNGSASSSVFEILAKDSEKKELILLLDEIFGDLDAAETITWIYDTDYEFLNIPDIEKIIVVSKMMHDYKLRLLLSGIDEKKIVCIDNYKDAYKYVSLEKETDIYILYDVEQVSISKEVSGLIKNRIKEGTNNNIK